MKYSIPAIYKGIMYSEQAMRDCEELFKHLQYNDFSEIRYNVPKTTLNTRIKKARVFDYAIEILKIAERGLRSFDTGEEYFLEPIKEYTFNKKTPADIIVQNWNGCWNKDLRKLVNYLSSPE